MSLEKLVAKQALQIQTLQEELALVKDSAREVLQLLVCIGGPLNGNNRRFNKKQLKLLWNIHDELYRAVSE